MSQPQPMFDLTQEDQGFLSALANVCEAGMKMLDIATIGEQRPTRLKPDQSPVIKVCGEALIECARTLTNERLEEIKQRAEGDDAA